MNELAIKPKLLESGKLSRITVAVVISILVASVLVTLWLIQESDGLWERTVARVKDTSLNF